VAPALVIEASHSVRDVSAVLGSPADAEVKLMVNVNGTPYCPLRFDPWATTLIPVEGNTLEPLPLGAQVTLSVLSVGSTVPGSDLTVIIRL
jgi:hypothetical protein